MWLVNWEETVEKYSSNCLVSMEMSVSFVMLTKQEMSWLKSRNMNPLRLPPTGKLVLKMKHATHTKDEEYWYGIHI